MTGEFTINLQNGARRKLGGEAPCFIIAEIGTNWHAGDSNDMTVAKQLIDAAAEAGCDAVKFQTYRPEQVYAPNAGMSDYLTAAGIRRPIIDVIAERVMPVALIPPLAAYATKRNLVLMSSCFSLEDIEVIDPHTPFHKLASYEISHARLIDRLAATGKPLIMSTGASTPEDISWAVNRYRRMGGRGLALLQCTAKYPAPDESMNLSVIPWLARRFNCVAGLSDHSPHPLWAPVAAVALGAKIVEKHITLDKSAAGPDHFNSIEPNELAQMVSGIRAVERMVGDGRKRIEPAEAELAVFARRRIQSTRTIAAGEVLREGENMAILRPGKRKPGAHPRELPLLQSKVTTKLVAAGDGITLAVVKPKRGRTGAAAERNGTSDEHRE
jgi:N-acetylneuraminate synthase